MRSTHTPLCRHLHGLVAALTRRCHPRGLLAGAALLASPARAHVGAPVDAIDVAQVGAAGRALEASIGLIWTETGGDWRWVCHEAVTRADAVLAPRYAVAGRHWVAVVSRLEQSRTGTDAVYWTDDGCDWTVAEGLEGHEIEALAMDGGGELVLAVSRDREAASNRIYRSTDGGRSFGAVLEVEGQELTSVVLATGSAGTAVVGGVDTAGQGWLHWSGDQGLSWSSAAVVEGEVVAMALHPDDPTVGFAVIDGVGEETLLRTADSGASVEVVLAPGEPISDVEVGGDGAAWVAVGGSAFLRAADGRAFELVTAAPPGLGLQVADETVLLATRFELLNEALYSGTAAAGFDPEFSFYELDGPLDCPAETVGATVCAPLYPVLEESLGLVWPDSGGPGGDGGEGDAGAGAEGPGTGGDGGADRDSASPQDGLSDGKDGGSGCGSRGLVWLLPLGLAGVALRRPRRP